jgi:ABC transporter transmembrane region
LLCIAFITSFIHGVLLPAFSIVFGRMTEEFTPNKSKDDIVRQASGTALNMFFIGLGSLFAAFISLFLFSFVGSMIAGRVKKLYFKKMME